MSCDPFLALSFPTRLPTYVITLLRLLLIPSVKTDSGRPPPLRGSEVVDELADVVDIDPVGDMTRDVRAALLRAWSLAANFARFCEQMSATYPKYPSAVARL